MSDTPIPPWDDEQADRERERVIPATSKMEYQFNVLANSTLLLEGWVGELHSSRIDVEFDGITDNPRLIGLSENDCDELVSLADSVHNDALKLRDLVKWIRNS